MPPDAIAGHLVAEVAPGPAAVPPAAIAAAAAFAPAAVAPAATVACSAANASDSTDICLRCASSSAADAFASAVAFAASALAFMAFACAKADRACNSIILWLAMPPAIVPEVNAAAGCGGGGFATVAAATAAATAAAAAVFAGDAEAGASRFEYGAVPETVRAAPDRSKAEAGAGDMPDCNATLAARAAAIC